MLLSQQVVSLPIAKRLEELGVKQDWKNCLFVWNTNTNEPTLWQKDRFLESEYTKNHDYRRIYSAFTVAELGEEISKTGNQCLKNVYRSPDGNYHWDYGDDHHMIETSEADIRGSILCYLLEQSISDKK